MKPHGLKETTIAMAFLNPCAFLFIDGQPPEVRWVLFVVFTLIVFFSYWVLWKYWNGVNWARILVLFTSVLALLNITEFTNSNLLQKIIIAIEAVLGMFLLYWLNTASVKRYFQSLNRNKESTSLSKRIVGTVIVIVGILLSLFWGARAQRTVEISTLGTVDGKPKRLATTSLFGIRLSEGEVSTDGVYHGIFRSWHLNGHIRQEGQFDSGFWNGEWKFFDQSGQLVTVREFNHGKLVKLFRVEADSLSEISENERKFYETPNQMKPERVSR